MNHQTIQIINEKQTAELAELFRALGNPNRVRILAALVSEETNVSSLAETIGISESAVSHQMRTLRLMRIVRARKEGREVYYSLDDEHVTDLFQRGLEHVKHG